MGKKKSEEAPAMEGKVSRGVDFNLKKEDLMLLILEGRKEVMEEEIGKLQTTSTGLMEKIVKAQKVLKDKVEKAVRKTFNAEAKKLAATFVQVAEDDEEDDEDRSQTFRIRFETRQEYINYTRFKSSAIGDGKGGAY